jgi:hypothetical protein
MTEQERKEQGIQLIPMTIEDRRDYLLGLKQEH